MKSQSLTSYPMLKRLSYTLLFLVLLLAGCTQKATQVTPIDNKALFNDNSLRNAKPITISSENELSGKALNNETQATELPYNETEADSQLSAQAVLAGAKGFVALYRKSGATYEIRVYNQTNNAATLVYSGLQEVQSVAVNATGNRVVASMKNPSNNKFDIYLFQLDNGGTPFQLTTATLEETNVSMTRTGNKIAWERRTSGTNPLIKPFICTYNATAHTCALTSITNTVSQIQPSLSANGLYLAFVRLLSSPTRYEVVRYRFSDSSYTIIEASISTDVFSDPSIDDTGSKIMYLWKRASNATNYIRIKNLLTNTIATELSSTVALEHPFITAEGLFTSYAQLNTAPTPDRMQVRTRNMATNVVATQEAGAFDYFQPFWMVPCGSGTTLTGDQTLTTQAQVNALAGVSKITGNLILNPSTTSLDLSPLASLTEVTGNFDLTFNNIQTTLSGFECLTTVGRFKIDEADALQSISGFAVLNSVGGDFNINSNAALTSISGFGALTTVGSFRIDSNAALTSIPAFSTLTTVGGEFNINSNAALTSISGFAALTSVGNFNIKFHAALTSISGFSALTSVGGFINISFNNVLTSISGFNLLESGRIGGTATVSFNPQLNCQNPDPHFSPVDVSTDNSVNCFTDIAVVGFAFADQPGTASYTPNTARSFNATSGTITANRTATGTYNIVFSGLTLDANSNVQVTANEDFAEDNYCNIQSVSGSAVNVRCFDSGSNALADTQYTIAITDKTTGSAAKVSSYALADDKASASYTPATATSYNSYGAGITATRSGTGVYQVTFDNGDFEFDSNVQVTALDEKAYCGIDGWNGNQISVFCFDQASNAIDSRYSLAVIDATPPAGTTTKIVGYAFANNSTAAEYTPNPLFAYNQIGFGVSATRTVAGIYHTIFTGLDLSSNYHVQITSRGNNANYCVLGPSGPIFGSDDVLTTCYNLAGTAANTVFSIWVVQK